MEIAEVSFCLNPTSVAHFSLATALATTLVVLQFRTPTRKHYRSITRSNFVASDSFLARDVGYAI